MALLAVAALAAFHVVIRPGSIHRTASGRPRLPRTYQTIGAIAFVAVGAPVVPLLLSKGKLDLQQIILGPVLHYFAEHAPVVVAAALVLGLFLYRSLQKRFGRMEAPPRTKVQDTWFAEI